MLTPRGLTVLALGILAWTLGRLLGVDELYVVSAAAVAMVALAVLSTRASSTRIAARRSTTATRAHVAQPVTIEVQLRNDGRWPATMLLVEDRRPAGVGIGRSGRAAGIDASAARFVVPGLRPRQVVDLRSQVVGRRRGRYAVGPLRVRLRDALGLAERSRRYRSFDDLIVYPAIEPIEHRATRGLRQGSAASASRRVFHQGEEFHTMRAYVTGDDLRHVHWPSTAHRGSLMVRQLEMPRDADAVVALDTRAAVHHGVGRGGTFERAVSIAASVTAHLRDQRYAVRLVAGPTAPVDAGGDQALVCLAEVAPSRDTGLVASMAALRQAGTGLLVTVVRPPVDDDPLSDLTEVRALLRAADNYRTRVALVVGHHDVQRCDALARLLQVAGWRAAVVACDEPLDAAWHRALLGSSPTNAAPDPQQVDA